MRRFTKTTPFGQMLTSFSRDYNRRSNSLSATTVSSNKKYKSSPRISKKVRQNSAVKYQYLAMTVQQARGIQDNQKMTMVNEKNITP
jgi:hypothetical protein